MFGQPKYKKKELKTLAAGFKIAIQDLASESFLSVPPKDLEIIGKGIEKIMSNNLQSIECNTWQLMIKLMDDAFDLLGNVQEDLRTQGNARDAGYMGSLWVTTKMAGDLLKGKFKSLYPGKPFHPEVVKTFTFEDVEKLKADYGIEADNDKNVEEPIEGNDNVRAFAEAVFERVKRYAKVIEDNSNGAPMKSLALPYATGIALAALRYYCGRAEEEREELKKVALSNAEPGDKEGFLHFANGIAENAYNLVRNYQEQPQYRSAGPGELNEIAHEAFGVVIHMEFDIPPHNKQIMNGSITLTKWIDNAFYLYYDGVDFSGVLEPKESIEEAFISDDVIKEYRSKFENTCGSFEELVQLIEVAEKFALLQSESFEKLKAIKESNNAKTIEYIEVLPEVYSLPKDSAEFNKFLHEDIARYIMKLLYLSQPLKEEDVEFINVALRTGEEDAITMEMIANNIESNSSYWDGTHDLLPRMTSYAPVYDLARVKLDFHNGKYDEMPSASFGVWSKFFNNIRSSFLQLTNREACEKYNEELDAFERRYSERYYSDLTTITSQMMGMYK